MSSDDKDQYVDPNFTIVFKTVTWLTVFFLLVDLIAGVFITNPQGRMMQVLSAVSNAWQVGLGRIFGLLGGRQAP